MRVVLGVLVGLVGGAVVWLLLAHAGGSPGGAPAFAPLPVAGADQLAALEGRLARLEDEVQRLALELARGADRTPVVAVAPPAPEASRQEGFDPRWYLAQYVRSFEAGGDGSDYFRLAVDAYALELLGPIAEIVRNPAAHEVLRAKLAAMLGTPRFAGNAVALETLLELLRTSSGKTPVAAALTALEAIGDAATGIALERLVWELRSAELQQQALAVLVRLCGPDANRSLERLYGAAPGAVPRTLVLASLSAADPDAALGVLRLASTGEDEVRLFAARVVQRFRGEAFIAFVDEWLGYERHEEVRRLLGEARGRMSQVPPYAAQKATGAPDANPQQDHPNAWASARANMGLQWLELGYRPARRASALRIHEVNVPGAVVEVVLVDEAGARHRVWAGEDPTTRPGVFQVAFPPTSYRVARARIVLDTDRRNGWAEIDAVELVGPDGNAWAVDAAASSAYGQ